MQTTPKIAITTEKRVPETEVSDDDPGACRKKSWLSQFKNSITRLDSFSEVPFLKKKRNRPAIIFTRARSICMRPRWIIVIVDESFVALETNCQKLAKNNSAD